MSKGRRKIAKAPPVMIEAQHIEKTYRAQGVAVQALAGVSLQIRAGEMVAIMGASGSGKTTLLNCLAGLETVDGGSIVINGSDLAQMDDVARTAFRARTMGFVFQTFNLLPVLTAIENVELPQLILRVPAAEARRHAHEQLAAVGLADRANHRPAELSGGQRQRVAIARALINKPLLLFADEPTGSLDSEAATSVMNLFAELNRSRGQTIILVTHASDIAARADRILTMRDGQIVRSN